MTYDLRTTTASLSPRRPLPAAANLLALLAALLLAPVAAPASGQAGRPPKPEAGRRLEEAKRLAADYAARVPLPGLAVAIADANGTLWAGAWGTADLRGGAPMTADTAVPLGALGQSFTALLVLQLAESGVLGLDDPVVRHLPWFRLADKETSDRITLRHLLNNASAIPSRDAWLRLGGGQSEALIEEGVRALSSTHSRGAPGASFEQANENWCILGLVAMRATGRGFGHSMRERLLGPMAMERSGTELERLKALSPIAGSWFGVDGFLPARPGLRAAAMPAGSCFVATARDMGNYMACLLGGGTLGGKRVVSSKSLELMWSPALRFPGIGTDFAGHESSFGYGMGWMTVEIDGRRLVFHGGNTYSASSMTALDPELGFGVSVLANAHSELDPYRHTQYLVLLNNMLHALAGRGQSDWGRPLRPNPASVEPRVPQEKDWLVSLHGTWKGEDGASLELGPATAPERTGTELVARHRAPLSEAEYRVEFLDRGRLVLTNPSGAYRASIEVDGGGRARLLTTHHGIFTPPSARSGGRWFEWQGTSFQLPAGWTADAAACRAVSADGRTALRWGRGSAAGRGSARGDAIMAEAGFGRASELARGGPFGAWAGSVYWESAAYLPADGSGTALSLSWTDDEDEVVWFILETEPSRLSAACREVLRPLQQSFR